MRAITCLIAGLGLTAHSVAAGQACPPRVTPQLEAVLGQQIAQLSQEDWVYRPGGLTMLGQPVPFVVVQKDVLYDDSNRRIDPIGRISFRLGDLQREDGLPYPHAITSAFDRAYPGNGCPPEPPMQDCSEYLGSDGGRGTLRAVHLARADYSLDEEEANGPGVALLRREEELYQEAGGAPAYLICEYEALD